MLLLVYLGSDQGCLMVCFQTKNPNLGKFWRVLQWKILVYFMIIWSILRPLEIFYGHLVYFVANWYISPRFGILHQEKSDNPGSDCDCLTRLSLSCINPFGRFSTIFFTFFSHSRHNFVASFYFSTCIYSFC
jgi:hypothetical protein